MRTIGLQIFGVSTRTVFGGNIADFASDAETLSGVEMRMIAREIGV